MRTSTTVRRVAGLGLMLTSLACGEEASTLTFDRDCTGEAALGADCDGPSPASAHHGTVLALASVCEQRVVGSLDSCQTTVSLRDAAVAACAADGLAAGPVGFAKPCSDGKWHLAEVSCCGLPPEPEAPVCESVVEASAVCQSEADFKALARVRCGGAHRVTDVAVGGACGSGWKFGKFTCCDAPGVELPDPVDVVAKDGPCGTATFVLDNACAKPAALRDEATRICDEAGRRVTDVRFVGSCGDGAFATATVSWCDLPEATDKPAAVCASGLAGGPSACATVEAWRQHAASSCAAQGLVASAVDTFGACADGKTQYARFSCCPALAEEEKCVVADLGGGSYCAPAEAWAAAAKSHCQESGRAVEAIGVVQSCGPGLWRGAKVGCCAAPPPAVPAIPNPHAAVCTDSDLLAPVCRPEREWADVARLTCDQRGAAVDQLTLLSGCHGGALGARVRCCSPGASPVCEKRAISLDTSCIGRSSAEKLAQKACAASGKSFGGLVSFAGCEGGQGGTGFSYKCCP